MKNYLAVTERDPRFAFYHTLDAIREHGAPVSPRGMDTLELRNVTLEIEDTTACVPEDMGRNFNRGLAAVEALSILGGVASESLLVAAAPQYLNFTGGAVTGAYGPRIREQMPYVINMLMGDDDTRQAVVMIWNPETDLYREHGDRPCTTQMSFMIRDDTLMTNTYMRSQDAFLGLPYDLTMFTQLHLTVASILDVEPGPLIHTVRSMHLYVRDMLSVEKVTRPPDESATRLLGINAASWTGAAVRARHLLFNADTDREFIPTSGHPFTTTERWLVDAVKPVRDKATKAVTSS